MSDDDALEFARSRGMIYLEASAKTKAGIRQAFEEVRSAGPSGPRRLLRELCSSGSLQRVCTRWARYAAERGAPTAPTLSAVAALVAQAVRRIMDTPALLVDTHVGGGAAGGLNRRDAGGGRAGVVQLNAAQAKPADDSGGCGC